MEFDFRKNKNAFTLIELLLYVAVVSILVLTISSFLNIVMQAKEKRQTIAEVEQQGASIAYFISQNIKMASGITSPAMGVSNPTLILSSSDILRNPTIFKVVNNVMVINLSNGADIPLHNDKVSVSNFSCTNLGKAGTSGSINCQFTLSSLNSSNRFEYSFSKKYNVSASRRY